jgi:hypothetical protein
LSQKSIALFVADSREEKFSLRMPAAFFHVLQNKDAKKDVRLAVGYGALSRILYV